MIQIEPKVGAKCWVDGDWEEEEDLPWPDRQQLTIVAVDPDSTDFVVRDEHGLEEEVSMGMVDTGVYYLMGREEIPESHPLAAEFHRHAVAQAKEEIPGITDQSLREMAEASMNEFRWYLERNGYDPDEPPHGPKPVFSRLPAGEVTPLMKNGVPTTGTHYHGPRVRS